MSNFTLPPVLTVGEAARYSGLHRDRVSAAIRKRELPAVNIEGRRFVRPPDLTAWLESLGLTIVNEVTR
jgi:excisionase family DNA binding protein